VRKQRVGFLLAFVVWHVPTVEERFNTRQHRLKLCNALG
jgi:hypothetical protein